jgi:NADH-ubiquinone oxidoreductase chain 2
MFTNSINNFQKNIHCTYINRITIITLLISILYTYNTLYFQSIGKGISLYNGLYQITVQSQIIEILLLIVGTSILLSWPYLILKKKQAKDAGAPLYIWEKVVSLNKSDQYSLIAIFSILGGSLLMSSLDLLSMYLSIELQSFALYILATLNKDKLSATNAGLKYFLLGSLSSCFILLGSAVIYSYTGLTQFEAINTLLSVPFYNNIPSLEEAGLLIPDSENLGFLPSLAEAGYNNLIDIFSSFSSSATSIGCRGEDINKAFTIGLILILIGFLFKISAAPFHQ